jgi:hypothetical protein
LFRHCLPLLLTTVLQGTCSKHSHALLLPMGRYAMQHEVLKAAAAAAATHDAYDVVALVI